MTLQLTMHAELGTDGYELLSIDSDRQASRCTAQCLDARSELRTAILEALAEGQGTRRVAQAFGVSREVVRALVKQVMASGELDQVKQRLGADAFALANATLGRISDELDDMPRASLPIVYGVLIDKGQLLTGGPTARIIREDAPADINELIDSLPRALPVDSRENSPAKAGGSGAQVLLQTVAGDSESHVSCPSSEGDIVDRPDHGQTDPKKGGA